MISDTFAAVFLLAGAFFMFVAGLGVYRMPDLPTRMHATTKAGVLGGGLMMIGLMIHFADIAVTARALAIIGFIFLTGPVAAHIIGRAGYFVGVPLWEGTVKDELKDRYNPETHILSSQEKHEDDPFPAPHNEPY